MTPPILFAAALISFVVTCIAAARDDYLEKHAEALLKDTTVLDPEGETYRYLLLQARKTSNAEDWWETIGVTFLMFTIFFALFGALELFA